MKTAKNFYQHFLVQKRPPSNLGFSSLGLLQTGPKETEKAYMNNFKVKIFLTVFAVLTTFEAKSADLVFESDVQIKKNDQNAFASLKAGEGMVLEPGDNVFVMTKKNLPLLIVAPMKDNAKIVVPDSNMSAALQDQLQPTLQKATSEIVDGLRKAETLIQKKDFSQASAILLSLKGKYKDISSLLFMSGTLAYLMNNKSSAVDDLQRGLALDPSNESAKKLLTQLKGGA
jgi:hypothetical protein